MWKKPNDQKLLETRVLGLSPTCTQHQTQILKCSIDISLVNENKISGETPEWLLVETDIWK